ncbi:MAG: hypothetical protein R3B90_08620 [Planctomycetaceae bacterium]
MTARLEILFARLLLCLLTAAALGDDLSPSPSPTAGACRASRGECTPPKELPLKRVLRVA